ncbi:DUF5590 domain-containing protein [Aerococcus kribbianus]|uniref:DUF5590 domain-containing protein n=1 Tax=Aerococcus kribbianus TaxID=2999064 RepID=A0A9X3JFH7_9LACT|nr:MULTISPECIES: DUF5590 domain-containing protein [unclassified Aerococcus]MCZ0717648.1 DUF5590 domain-containing protein [Aerococcus sp. YH-aer221]MCZ0725936.1 DUF5590 domain-containing protein [Aerococcus sp. YH-aer222]
MKHKVINTLIFILFAYILSTGAVYFSSQKDIAQWEADTLALAENKAGLRQANNFYVFTKNKTYYTVSGENDEGQAIYFTYSPDDDQTYTANVDELVNEDNALALTRNDLGNVQVKTANIGIENGEYVWEVSFRDENGYLGYHYIDASDAQWYETINNL